MNKCWVWLLFRGN